MTISNIDIANEAIVLIGGNKITSFSDTDSKSAITANMLYNVEKESLLRSHVWNFAKKYSILNELQSEPSFQFSKIYQLPNDFLRLVRINEHTGGWEIVQDKFYTCMDKVEMVYVENITDPNLFDPLFRSALVFKLASLMAYPITGSESQGRHYAQQFEFKIREAKQVNALEGYPKTLKPASWNRARNSWWS